MSAKSEAEKLFDDYIESLNKMDLSEEAKERLITKYREDLMEASMDPSDKKIFNHLRIWFSIVFLIGYLGLIWILLNKFFNGLMLDETSMNLIFAIWGAMSAKINTVTDYIF